MPHTKSLIEKYKELVSRHQSFSKWIIKHNPEILESERGRNFIAECEDIESELSLLQEQEKEPNLGCGFELQFCEKCYQMTNHLDGKCQKCKSVDQSGIREELIKFACRNNKYQTTNIRNTEVPAFLEMLRKGHERSVDDYLKSNQ